MGEYDSPKRGLVFPLKDPLVIQRTTQEDVDCSGSSFVWPEDSDERVPIVFNLSLNEFVVLASTIDVGSDIAYGEDAIRVWWLWDRVLRCPMSLCDAIVQAIQTCTDVQDEILALVGNAIGNPTPLQEQLRTFVVGDQLIRDYVQTTAQETVLSVQTRSQNILREAACGDGYLYNQAVVIADELGNMSTSFFAAINAATTVGEAVSIVLALIPWTGVSLIPSVVELLADYLFNTFQTAYNAGAGSVDMQALYCDLWHEICHDCEYSIDQITNFYIGKLGESVSEDPVQTMLDIITFITGGTASGEEAYYAMHVFMLACIRVSQSFMNVDFGSFAQTVRNAGTVDNPDYSLCDPCVDPSCYDPDNFHLGEVLAQSGLEYDIEFQSGAMIWGQDDMFGPVCRLESFTPTAGFVSSATMLDENLVSRNFSELPLNIRYLDAVGAEGTQVTLVFS